MTQEVISAGKTPTEYNSGTVVRLEAFQAMGGCFIPGCGVKDTGNRLILH